MDRPGERGQDEAGQHRDAGGEATRCLMVDYFRMNTIRCTI